MSDDDIAEYDVEYHVTGTWRESVVAETEEEAADVVAQNLEDHLDREEGEWGDLGFSVVGFREVDE